LRDARRYPTLSDKRVSPPSQVPLSITVTDFHYLLLYPDRLLAISRLNEQVTYEELLPRVRWPAVRARVQCRVAPSPMRSKCRVACICCGGHQRAGHVFKIAADPIKNTLWVYTSTSIFEIVITDEDRNVWEYYLNENQFERALEFAKVRRRPRARAWGMGRTI